MIKCFCDHCSKECSITNIRRWEHVSGDLGIELVILSGKVPYEGHLCDDCVFKINWNFLETKAPQLGIKQQQAKMAEVKADLDKREKELMLQSQRFTDSKKKMDIDEIEADCKAVVEKEYEEILECKDKEIKRITIQLEAMKADLSITKASLKNERIAKASL